MRQVGVRGGRVFYEEVGYTKYGRHTTRYVKALPRRERRIAYFNARREDALGGLMWRESPFFWGLHTKFVREP